MPEDSVTVEEIASSGRDQETYVDAQLENGVPEFVDGVDGFGAPVWR